MVALQQQIQAKIDSENAVDIGYWEALLQQLKAHMAWAQLRDRHQTMLHKKLFQLKVEVVYDMPRTLSLKYYDIIKLYRKPHHHQQQLIIHYSPYCHQIIQHNVVVKTLLQTLRSLAPVEQLLSQVKG